MNNEAVVVLGLPASGKTTFLAALWHLLSARKVPSRLSLVKLKAMEAEHLKEITTRWLHARKQERTFQSKNRTAVISLKTTEGQECHLSFPDIAGEAFAQIWESRECDTDVVDALKAQGVMLFIHSSNINYPGWISDDTRLSKQLGITRKPGEPIPWEARFAPTQVQLVDLLRCLQEGPLNVGPRKLAVILSAWDLAEGEEKTPEKYLEAHLPLLHQYLNYGLNASWQFKIYGVSAQGGEYDGDKDEPCADAQRMRDLDVPSHRIKVEASGSSSNDLTEPLFWLLG
ncbi:TRAFAC clade GTPase domain-containing protein [Massilia sp. LXY-6]|uniref:TRAFAC clade GTPase domain-containing protein n=1 Tax=Massilia sp. LXY-6 TaxID=3379823 RepID=UPI003EDFCCA8